MSIKINSVNCNTQQSENIMEPKVPKEKPAYGKLYSKEVPLETIKAYSNIHFNGKKHSVDNRYVIILLGAPNSGKGTYSNKISKKYNIPQISTGDILKKERREGTELGKKVQHYIESGELVPDETILKIVHKRISKDDCQKGFILDGFPRTINQAKQFSKMMKTMPNATLRVINLDVPQDVLYARSANRMVCADCQKSFNTRTYKEDTCDECGGKLVKRPDDTPEILTKRLKEYDEKTKPVADFFNENGNLKNVKIDATPEKECNISDVMDKISDDIESDDNE